MKLSVSSLFDRYIGIGVVVLGLGSLLFASPHYIAGPYRGGQQSENICQRVTNTSSRSVSNFTQLLTSLIAQRSVFSQLIFILQREKSSLNKFLKMKFFFNIRIYCYKDFIKKKNLKFSTRKVTSNNYCKRENKVEQIIGNY